MEDVPQPADEPYAERDEVRVYVGKNDTDSRFHGTRAIIINRFEDDLSEETGRSLDQYNYRVRPVNGDSPLPVQFRHRDLVPTKD